MEPVEDRNELANVFRAYIEAVNSKDIEACYKFESESFGYGYRSQAFREVRNKSDYFKAMRNFYASMKDYEIRIDSEYIKVFNNVGFASGEYTEKITEHDGTLRYVRGRGTGTWMKLEGNWKLFLYHRDAQYT